MSGSIVWIDITLSLWCWNYDTIMIILLRLCLQSMTRNQIITRLLIPIAMMSYVYSSDWHWLLYFSSCVENLRLNNLPCCLEISGLYWLFPYLNYAIDRIIKNHMERYSCKCPIWLYLYCHKHAVQVCTYCSQLSYFPWYAYQSMFLSYVFFHYCISFLFSLCTFSTADQMIKYFVDVTYPYIEEYNYSYSHV